MLLVFQNLSISPKNLEPGFIYNHGEVRAGWGSCTPRLGLGCALSTLAWPLLRRTHNSLSVCPAQPRCRECAATKWAALLDQLSLGNDKARPVGICTKWEKPKLRDITNIFIEPKVKYWNKYYLSCGLKNIFTSLAVNKILAHHLPFTPQLWEID